MVEGIDWDDVDPDAWPAPRRPRLRWPWRKREAPYPHLPFPTVEQLVSLDVPKTTCVCNRPIARWPYPGQGSGTAGDGQWWVHVDNARRSHTRDTLSPHFWPGVNQEPYAKPVWQRDKES